MVDRRWFSVLLLWAITASALGQTNEPPAFIQDMNNLPLSESTPVGTIVYTLQGKDPEGSPIKYGLVGTKEFMVNPDTGDVMLVQPLDRETLDTIKFLVSIEDEVPGGINNFVQVPITVIVLDENDNPPIFQNSPYEVNVPEDELVGATILQNIYVEDRDSGGDNLEVGCIANPQWPEACEVFGVVTMHSSSHQYRGSLILKNKLDYNIKHFYQFQLLATDGTLNSSANVEVKVLDVQDSPPVFLNTLTAALDEDVPVNTVALTVRARDADRAYPRPIYYQLLTNPLDFFVLDSTTGDLKTAKPLDREALTDPSSPLNLTVRASEIVDGQPVFSNVTSSLATVTITIRDVNDEPPRFNRKEYRISVPESLPVGTPLPNLDMSVIDTDVGTNSVFTLGILNDFSGFTVEPSQATGATPVTLRLNSTLDYEDPNQRKFILEVIAEELYTNPPLSTKASVIVTVVDVNDNAPQFLTAASSASVVEDAVVGSYVTTLTAKDRDTGRFGTEGIVYQLFGVGAELFVADRRTGVIAVADCITPGRAPCLDIETRADYFLQYRATDDDGAGQTTVVSLQISLEDANDNPPVFNMPVYKASIDEDALKFEPELQVQARDADQNSEIRYSIVKPLNSAFWIDKLSGKIELLSEIDIRDEGDFNHTTLTILASDGVYNATCKVEISIRDVNNHAPVFESVTYNASVPENAPIGSYVTQVKATDLDSGVNANIAYSIKKGALEAFVVNNLSGLVTVSSLLDYDRRNTYKIQIVATDAGVPSLSGTTELIVSVVNVNDKKPYFTPHTQRAEVSADASIGTVVHNLQAIDPDVEDTDDLFYELNAEKPITAVDNNGKEVTENIALFMRWFTVLSNGSVVVSQRLQRPLAAVLTLPVSVEDVSSSTLQRAEGELIITIVDVNRHSPVFPQSHYSERLTEEQPVGSVLAVYSATDKESPIAYIDIQPPSPYFQIDNQTGTVKSTQRVDYEKVRTIEFTLVAVDTGVPQLTGSATVTVDVTNVNDEEPVFDTPEGYSSMVVENAKQGTPVLSVHAVDLDDSPFGVVRYNLSGDHAALFDIDPVGGEVSVARGAVIDRETSTRLRLQALATDGKYTVTAPVEITVADENDNAPVFSQQVYKSTISENLQLSPPAAILQVRAEDRDVGVNALVSYRIVSQSEPDIFSINESTGIIYPARPVTGNTTYHITVSATDEAGRGPHNDTARVDISVTSVNGHSPKFVAPVATQRVIEIPENAAEANFLVMTVKATDEDKGDNGHISYYLKVDNQNVHETTHFSIDPNSGELRTKTFLDREERPAYQLVLVATDHGSPAAFETLHFLTVLLEDCNDNVPTFSSEHYKFQVLENQPQGIIIGSVKAIDKDSGDNGKVFYYILEGNDQGALILDKTQGLLRTNATFDRETRSDYFLRVYASNSPINDSPSVALNVISKDNTTHFEHNPSLAYVTITVLDENDNEPQFEKEVYYAGIKYQARVNEPVISVLAIDEDYQENGTLAYLVAASNLYKFRDPVSSGSIVPSPFNITQDGLVMTASFMSEYNQDRFVLDIIAQEIAPPFRRTTAQLYIWVIDSTQTIRTVVSRACVRSAATFGDVCKRLSDASGALIVAGTWRNYVHADTLLDDWCEMELLAVDPTTYAVLPVDRVLEIIDSKYNELKDLYQIHGIETVIASSSSAKLPASFDPALAALIALLLVLFTGIVTFVVVCACLKHWVISHPSLQSSKGDSLARRRILEELSTTENPLWLESKLRPYEEQELTMNVFGDQVEQPPPEQPTPTDNTYATIQTPHRPGPMSEYSTLAREHSPLEAARGFQGSTFKPPTPETPEPPPRPIITVPQIIC